VLVKLSPTLGDGEFVVYSTYPTQFAGEPLVSNETTFQRHKKEIVVLQTHRFRRVDDYSLKTNFARTTTFKHLF